jgi:hypothetical protein
MATNILGFSEQEFWKMKPRKLIALWNVHSIVQGYDSKEDKHKGFIDEIF